jgi:hypothetical protein
MQSANAGLYRKSNHIMRRLAHVHDHRMNYCDHCPVKGENCRGLDVRRFCELMDANHPAYNPEYLKVLVVPYEVPKEQPPMKSGCCGGNAYG